MVFLFNPSNEVLLQEAFWCWIIFWSQQDLVTFVPVCILRNYRCVFNSFEPPPPPVTRRATSSSSCAREDWHVHVFLPNARRQAAGPPDTRPSARPRSRSLLPPARPRSTASSAPFLTHDFSPSRSCRILCLRTWLRFRSPRVLRPAPARGGPRFFL